MATHDYVIDNQLFPATRTDLNNALQAIVTNNSSATAPSPTYSFQFWADTSTNPATIRQRNAGNTAWIVVGTADTTNWGLAPLSGANFTSITVPTRSLGDSTTNAASTAFVQSAIANNPSWINATLLNSWTSSTGAGYPNVSYRKLPTGTVVLQGMATKASPGTSVIFTLPAGYRPASTQRFVSMDTVPAVIEVGGTGDVIIQFTFSGSGNPPSTAFVTLNSVRFEV